MKRSTSSPEACAVVIGLARFVAAAFRSVFGVRLSHCGEGGFGQCPLRPHPVASGSIADCQTGSRPLSELC